MKNRPGLFIACCLAPTACVSDASGPTHGAGVEVRLAPLDLPRVSNACYRLTVTNAAGLTVWSRPGVCSSDFGSARGDVTYIGPCDAQLVAGARQMNTISLELEDIFDGTAPIDRDTYRNPCGHADNGNDDGFDACTRSFECRENQDVLVKFDLVLMRDAQQGFFDIAVNFDDIFCSAKLDCRYDTSPIEVLFTPDGERAQTAVVAVACTGGVGGAKQTVLHMNPVAVQCEDGTNVRLDPTIGPGNAWSEAVPDPKPSDALWQYATYLGTEALSCGDGDCNKMYWNVALGFDASAPGCVVTTSATASSGVRMSGYQTPQWSTYPWIDVAVNLTWPGAGGLLCDQNPLDVEGSGVQTRYTPIDEAKLFCHRFDGEHVATAPDESCDLYRVDRVIASPIGLSASPSVMPRGSWSTLVPSFARGVGVISNDVDATTVSVASGTPVPVSPLVTTVYTLTVTDSAGSARTAETVITVAPPLPPVIATLPPTRQVGIFYLAWHALAAQAMNQLGPAEQLTIEDVIRQPALQFSDILSKHGLLSSAAQFHYQARPQLGFYCLYRKRASDPTLIADCPGISGIAATHASQLLAAGIDFVYVDLTNFPHYVVNGAVQPQVDLLALRPLEVLFEEWAALRMAGVPTPRIAAWVPAAAATSGAVALYTKVLEVYARPANNALVLRHGATGAPIVFVVDRDDDPAFKADAAALDSIRAAGVVPVTMWGNLAPNVLASGRAGWMQPCTSGGTFTTLIRPDQPCEQGFAAATAIGKVVSVSASYQVWYSSFPFMSSGRLGGLTLKKQFETAFREQPAYLLINAWNEHIAQPQPNAALAAALPEPLVRSMGMTEAPPGDVGAGWLWVDGYGQDLSRDLEPTVQDAGSNYALLESCLRVYRSGHLACTRADRNEICCQLGSGVNLVRSLRGAQDHGALDSDHVVTLSDAERTQLVGAGYVEVCNYPQAGQPGLCGGGTSGDAPFQLYAGGGPLRAPLRRCRTTVDHFMSRSATCEGHTVEGLLGYVSLVRTSDSPRPLQRCYNTLTQRHSHWLGEHCPGMPGVTHEGLLGYVK